MFPDPGFLLTGSGRRTAKAGMLFLFLLCGHSSTEWLMESKAKHSPLALWQFQ